MVNLKVPVIADDHIQGNPTARITLIEYGDYECQACGLAYPIIKKIQELFGNEMRFIFRHFPLTEIHPYAEIAAEAAEYAAMNKLFWKMHHLIYTTHKRLTLPILHRHVESLNLSVEELEECIKTNKFKDRIRNDYLGGVYSGVNKTPGFFINDEPYTGPVHYDNLVKAISAYTIKT